MRVGRVVCAERTCPSLRVFGSVAELGAERRREREGSGAELKDRSERPALRRPASAQFAVASFGAAILARAGAEGRAEQSGPGATGARSAERSPSTGGISLWGRSR